MLKLIPNSSELTLLADVEFKDEIMLKQGC
jgi:hypothetical protein